MRSAGELCEMMDGIHGLQQALHSTRTLREAEFPSESPGGCDDPSNPRSSERAAVAEQGAIGGGCSLLPDLIQHRLVRGIRTGQKFDEKLVEEVGDNDEGWGIDQS